MKKFIALFSIFILLFTISFGKPKSEIKIIKKEKVEKTKVETKTVTQITEQNLNIKKINKKKNSEKLKNRNPILMKEFLKLEKEFNIQKEIINGTYKEKFEILKKQKHKEIQILKEELKLKKRELKSKLKKKGNK
jgi:hypothetical protein